MRRMNRWCRKDYPLSAGSAYFSLLRKVLFITLPRAAVLERVAGGRQTREGCTRIGAIRWDSGLVISLSA